MKHAIAVSKMPDKACIFGGDHPDICTSIKQTITDPIQTVFLHVFKGSCDGDDNNNDGIFGGLI